MAHQRRPRRPLASKQAPQAIRQLSPHHDWPVSHCVNARSAAKVAAGASRQTAIHGIPNIMTDQSVISSLSARRKPWVEKIPGTKIVEKYLDRKYQGAEAGLTRWSLSA